MTQRQLTNTLHPFAGLIDTFFADTLPEAFPGAAAPATDIAETETAFHIAVELPGIREADVQVEVHERNLKITAERPDTSKAEGLRWHRREQRFGKRARTIVLPDTANTATIEAKLEHGLLSITVQKHEKAQPVRVQVKAN